MKAFLRKFPASVLGLLALLPLACHLGSNDEEKNVFTFPSLVDSLQGADYALILLKDSLGQTLDTLFDGPVTPTTTFNGLPANHMPRGVVVLAIEGWTGGKAGSLVYKVDKKFDNESDQSLSNTIHLTPRCTIRIGTPPLQLHEGDSIPLPRVDITPSTLVDQSLVFLSRRKDLLAIRDQDMKALGIGSVTVVVSLKVFPAKADSFTLEIVSREQKLTPIDSLDQVPPNRPILRSPFGPVNTLAPTWTWTSGGGNGIGTYRFRLDNSDMSGATEIIDTLYTASTNLDPGTHTLYVQERNLAGNWSPSGRFALRIDTMPLPAPTVNVSPASPTSHRSPTWTWIGPPGNASEFYRFKLDNNDFRADGKDTTATSFQPPSALDPGSHTLFVQVRDSAGNWSTSGSATVEIDIDGPLAPVVSGAATQTNDPTPTWTWTSGGEGSGVYRYRLDNPDLEANATVVNGASFTPTGSLSEGIHTLYVQERDEAGNWSMSGIQTSRIDLTAPTAPRMDSTPYSPLNSLRPRWTWRSGTGGAKIFRARVDNANTEGATEQSDSSFTPAANLAEGRHTLFVQERDSAGNWSQTSSREIIVALRATIGDGSLPSNASVGNMEFDRQGKPYLTLIDHQAENAARILTLNGNSWMDLASIGFTPSVAPVLALDGEGTPYIAFSNSGQNAKAMVRRYTGMWWVDVGDNWISSNSARNFKLKFSPTGVLHVAYIEAGDSGDVIVIKRFRSSKWESLPALDPMPYTGLPYFSYSFTIDAIGQPVVAYQNYPADYRTSVIRFNGSSWMPLGQRGFSEADRDLTMTSGTGESLFLAYGDGGADNKVSVLRFNGSAWEQAGKRGISSGLVHNPTIATNTTGVPFLAYVDETFGNSQLKVMRLTGGSWVDLFESNNSPRATYEISLTLDPLGVPYVVFRDQTNSDKLTVIKVSFNP